MSVRMSVYLIWNWTRWAPIAPRSSCLFWFLVFFGLLLKALITISITFILIHNHTAITKHTLNCTPHSNKHQQTYEYTHNYTHTSKHVPQAYTYTHIHALRHFCTDTHTHVNKLTKIWFMIVKHNLGRTQAARNRRLTSSTCSSRISDTRSSTSRRRLTGQTRPIIIYYKPKETTIFIYYKPKETTISSIIGQTCWTIISIIGRRPQAWGL